MIYWWNFHNYALIRLITIATVTDYESDVRISKFEIQCGDQVHDFWLGGGEVSEIANYKSDIRIFPFIFIFHFNVFF